MARKKVECRLATWDDVDAELGELVELKAQEDGVESEMNDALKAIRDQFAPALAQIGEARSEAESQVKAFCVEHRADFGARKSRELTHGTVSFRLGNPTLALKNRDWNWKSVLASVKGAMNVVLRRCVRVKEEIDKEAVLAAKAAGKVTDQELAESGLKVAQKETFGIELRYEEPAEAGGKGAA